ncbi:hypothetical protein FGB62_91g08 [Gracilaria domingensis]|nr:hypothetical protein FGB62_91g08 [Gracilaria domingensis]
MVTPAGDAVFLRGETLLDAKEEVPTLTAENIPLTAKAGESMAMGENICKRSAGRNERGGRGLGGRGGRRERADGAVGTGFGLAELYRLGWRLDAERRSVSGVPIRARSCADCVLAICRCGRAALQKPSERPVATWRSLPVRAQNQSADF